ncbi:MAG: hypothetical protein IGS03_12455 [Candidatus Sericytochromatia bacterium]|nr:hypothetical protein [Candidatus Sericytochromatia bacterium]
MACAAALLLSACPASEEPTSTPSTAETQARQEPLPSAAPGQFQGLLVAAEGFQTFKACGSQKEVWVEDQTAAQALAASYAELHPMELEPVLLVARGEIKSTEGLEGFARDYEEALFVKEIQRLQSWWEDTRCFSVDFMASGSGPDWSLKVLHDGDVFFKSEESDFPYVETLAYSAPEQQGNSWRFRFRYRTPQPETLDGELIQERCSHAGKEYPYRAEIQFRGMTYSGCAEKF